MDLFSVTDFNGDAIVLTEKDWNRIVAKRLEVEPYVDEIRRTLQDPDVVYEGGTSDTKVFYGKDLLTDYPFRGCYVAVAVRYRNQPASIRTAYLAREMRANLQQLLYIKPRHR